jgi:hypothetical protein
MKLEYTQKRVTKIGLVIQPGTILDVPDHVAKQLVRVTGWRELPKPATIAELAEAITAAGGDTPRKARKDELVNIAYTLGLVDDEGILNPPQAPKPANETPAGDGTAPQPGDANETPAGDGTAPQPGDANETPAGDGTAPQPGEDQ